MQEEKNSNGKNQYLLDRKLRILIADDEKAMVDEIISNLNIENEDYEIIGYALSTDEERQKINELKPDIVITDIFRGSIGQKNAGGLEIIKEYSKKYFLPKFIVISFTPDYIGNNIVGSYAKYPSVDYNKIKKHLHTIKIVERSSFMRGYEEREENKGQKINKKESFINKLKKVLFD